jgi:phospholipase/lecithinase/hemolysin
MGREEMRKYQLAAALFAASILAGCGGGGAGDQSPKVKFTSQVSFGDSLSDVGSYAPAGGAVALAGGGQFTINIPGAKSNWTELMAAQVGLQATSCAAVTGGNNVATQTHAGCYAYGQGGARVTIDQGIGYTGPEAAGAYPGAMTESVSKQIARHLGTVTNFSGGEIVYVLAGANDILIKLGGLTAAVTAQVAADIGSGACVPADMQASNCVPAATTTAVTAAVTDVATAAGQLAALINTQITGKGATHVVVVNVPDVASTPFGTSLSASAKGVLGTMVSTFNAQLKAGLANNANVLLVDAYTVNHDQIINQTPYGLTNVTTTACNVAPGSFLATHFPTSSGDGSSLGCTTANPATMTTGESGDTHYMFADDVHPTPYGYWLLARYVAKEMLVKGWL